MDTRQARIAIIGGGAAGLSTALQLTELGCEDVTVLEQRHVAAGSSSLSAGVFTRNYLDRFDIETRVWSHEFFGYLERAAALPLRRIGYLRLVRDAASRLEVEKAAELQRELGVRDNAFLEAAEIKDRYPHLNTADLEGGLFLTDDGYLDGAVLCSIYAQLATEGGAKVLNNAGLTAVDTTGKAFVLETPRGQIVADIIVNAAGAWANQVGEMLGAPLGLIPQRHEAAVLRLTEPLGYDMPMVMDYVPGLAENGLYFRQEGTQQLVAGIHTNDLEPDSSDDPDNFSRTLSDEYGEELGSLLMHRLEGLDDIGLETGWAGLYPMSPDELPLLGATAVENVYACAGLGGVGIHTSPVAGRLVAEAVVHGEFLAVDGAERTDASRFDVAATS